MTPGTTGEEKKLFGADDQWRGLRLADAASLGLTSVLQRLEVTESGLTAEEAKRRLALTGPNAIRSHGARTLEILIRQVKNPLLVLLVAAATTSLVVGEQTDAVIILGIITLSVGLGFVNEYRAARTVEALHSRIRHTASAVRDGHAVEVDVIDLVPGDIVRLEVGDVVPADVRLLEAHDMECDEAVLTGEATPAEKKQDPAAPGDSLLDLPSCVFMGTVVRNGAGRGVVVQTGKNTEFGKIATRLGEAQEQTAFQQGLQSFSVLLLQVTIVLTVSIFVVNTALSRPLLDSALFSLAIAVGLTPQLLPAIVTVSLSLGSRRLAQKSVIVKRLVSIEDLGNVEVLFTDKTGTLTEGRITFSAAMDVSGEPSPDTLLLGLLCNSVIAEDGGLVGGNPLDRALWEADGGSASIKQFTRLSEAPFDYERRLMSVLVEDRDGQRRVITKGAPESLLTRCRNVPRSAQTVLSREFQAGSRVIAIATREAGDLSGVSAADERDLTLAGFLTFVDRVKPDAGAAIERLARLGVTVKIVTGDNDQVARKVCSDLKMLVGGVLTGGTLEEMSDEQLAAAIGKTTIFARVTPEQKSRLIRLQRKQGTDVGFLGDGVNDAIALHDADVGISVDSGTDVAKDAADIVLLEKDLDILADGVVEGRRVFSNTIKYVLMGTSSNFGNMFSAAGGSLVLSFLPMLPTQILLNNFLYDVSEMTIPTDNVDEELLRRPAHWDMSFIRRFMLFFGPISSAYDFLTFGVMIWVFNANETLFHTGWFVESLATQTLVIFVIRTRRTPFFRSLPSLPLLATTVGCVAVGIIIPFSPLAGTLGFKALPLDFFAILGLMVVTYLGLVELGKSRFFRPQPGAQPLARRKPPQERRIHRRAARWSHANLGGGIRPGSKSRRSIRLRR
ncbi:MAG TPA: magnesium-translocating P-type ATPase [Dehalococcoidia bacterium]|nr:magnesium-translocating P-type ATPase [Dehalococcoidia bacterium]